MPTLKKQKICHDDSCPPYDSYCSYCHRSRACDSEDFRMVNESEPDSIHIDEIKQRKLIDEEKKQECIAFAEWIAKEYWLREGAVSATDTLGKWFNIDTDNKEWHNLDLTTEQLYELYQQSLKNT